MSRKLRTNFELLRKHDARVETHFRDMTHSQFNKLWIYGEKGVQRNRNGYPEMINECRKFCPFDKDQMKIVKTRIREKKSNLRKKHHYSL